MANEHGAMYMYTKLSYFTKICMVEFIITLRTRVKYISIIILCMALIRWYKHCGTCWQLAMIDTILHHGTTQSLRSWRNLVKYRTVRKWLTWSDWYAIWPAEVNETHYSDVIMKSIASQITGLSSFAQPSVEAQIKENIKAPRSWLLKGQPTVNQSHKGPEFFVHLMTSSW